MIERSGTVFGALWKGTDGTKVYIGRPFIQTTTSPDRRESLNLDGCDLSMGSSNGGGSVLAHWFHSTPTRISYNINDPQTVEVVGIFDLKDNVEIFGGSGSLDNPFVIK